MTLEKTHARLQRLSRFAAMLGGLGIIFIAMMVTVDVLLRKFLHTTLGGASEIAGFIFAAGTALAYPYVLLDRANIRIDVVYARLPRKLRAVLDLVALVLLLGFVAMLTRSVIALLIKSWTAGSMSVGVINVAVWFPQLLWAAGFVLFSLCAVFLVLHAAVGLQRGDWGMVNRVAGVPTLEETIEEETHIEGGGHAAGAEDDSDGEAR